MQDFVRTPAGAPADRPSNWTDQYLADEASVPASRSAIDFATIRGFFWRQRLILVAVVALAVVAGYVVTLLTTPIYEATSSVRVDPEQQANVLADGDTLDSQISLYQLDSYLNTLAVVVESRGLAAQVVDKLKLADREDFLMLGPDARPEGTSDADWAQMRRDFAIGMLQGNLDAEVPQLQRVIEISYKSSDPKLAAAIANAYADAFLTDDIRRSGQKNAYAQAYLQEQIAALRTQLDTAQRQALGYARANRIIGQPIVGGNDSESGGGAPATITAATLENVNSTYAEARAKRIAAEQRWRAAAAIQPAALPEFQGNPVAQRLTGERAAVATRLADLRTRYGPEHPEIRELEAQLVTLDRQVGQIGSQIKAGIRQEYEVAQRQERALGGELSNVSGQTLDEQDRRVTFDQLNSGAKALESQLESLLDRYNQIAASANVRPSTMTLLDGATVPVSPVSPNLLKNLVLALLMGGGLALGLAVLRETLDDRLRSSDDVERKLGLSLLGLTPLIDKHEDLTESAQLAEAHSSIRAAVDFALRNPDHNVISLTSSQSGEGKTTTAVALARAYAKLGRSVLLIDGDLRRPSIAAEFHRKRPEKGFAEVLSGEIGLEQALLPDTDANLSVLPVGAIPSNPVEVVSSPRTEEFIRSQRRRFDMVIIDSPPVMGLADAPLLSRYADGLIFVVESNRAHFGAAKTALRRLRDGGTTVLGVVLTKFRALEAGQDYAYQYAYYSYGDKAN